MRTDLTDYRAKVELEADAGRVSGVNDDVGSILGADFLALDRVVMLATVDVDQESARGESQGRFWQGRTKQAQICVCL